MPFRYGIATLTALPHIFLRAEVEINGVRQIGIAAEGLPPKWFTKDPVTTFEQDLGDMFAVILNACDLARQLEPSPTLFGWWRSLYAAQSAWAPGPGYPPLLWGLGVSLIERAVIDAFCRQTQTPFARAVRENSLGIDLGVIHPELVGRSPAELLPAQPVRSIQVRHTIGFGDPLVDADIPADERLADGLPQALDACIEMYGLTFFKIKLAAVQDSDIERLRAIAALLEHACPSGYAFTLDGNEQYFDVDRFASFWDALNADPGLSLFMKKLLFVEQPFSRWAALDDRLGADLLAWRDRPAIIIDESDGELDSLPRALSLGYVGTSHKNCKGVFKGIANACLLESRRRENPEARLVMSAEDLANVGPVALLQDLAVVATLGMTHAERNGHHYFAGLSALPGEIQQQVVAEHGDLYRKKDGLATLDIREGSIAFSSVVGAPFGIGFDLDTSQFTSVWDWEFESL